MNKKFFDDSVTDEFLKEEFIKCGEPINLDVFEYYN